MTKALYYNSEQHSPYSNLALEAFLLETVPQNSCILYLWQNQKTVVIGRNQNCWKECNLERLKQDGGSLARRLSGGGAVFHDLGNLNFTFLAPDTDYNVEKQLEVILHAVNLLGIRAEKSGRNDLTVDSRKFSGNAFYSQNGRSCHHGTLLLRADTESMSAYLNVSREKLQSKGVESVKARVANLAEFYPDITPALMKETLVQAFGTVYGARPEKLDENRLDGKRIAALTEKFASPDWIYGRKIPFTFEAEKRFPWGNVQLQLSAVGGVIERSAVYSDAMNQELIASIRFDGCLFSSLAMTERLNSLFPGRTGLEQEMLRDICGLIAEQGI